MSRDNVAVDSRDKRGQTPLSSAAKWGREAVVKLLLSRHDVTVDCRDSFGRAPLDWARKCGKDAVVILLEQKMREKSLTARKRRIEEVSDDEEN